MTESFDVIVVGGGPAGLSSAYFMARKGFKVLVLERGRYPGSKNVYGGRVYSYYLERLFPGFKEKAPVHRWVTKERFSLVNGEESVTLEYSTPKSRSFTTTLTELTRWLAGKAEEAGAVIVTEARVSGLLKGPDGRVRGVAVNGEELEADLVVVAEGANRSLLESEGLAPPTRPEDVALGVKATLRLGEERINERLGLSGDEGLSWMLAGSVTKGIPDGCFAYTMRDSLAVGAVLWLGSASSLREPVYDIVYGLLHHPLLKGLVEGAELVEYSAHLTLAYPLRFVPPRLSGPGYVVVGDAAGLIANMGYTFRGVDFAVYSGYLAAEAYERVRGGEGWDTYDRQVRSSPVYREVRRYAKAHEAISRKEVLSWAPALASSLARLKLVEVREEVPRLREALVTSAGVTGLLRLIRTVLEVMSRL